MEFGLVKLIQMFLKFGKKDDFFEFFIFCESSEKMIKINQYHKKYSAMDLISSSRPARPTRKNTPTLTPRKQHLSSCSFSSHPDLKRPTYEIPRKKIKVQFCTFSKEKVAKLKKAKPKIRFDPSKTICDGLQKQVQKQSSKIRNNSPLKFQHKGAKGNKYLLSILLSHTSNQQSKQLRKTKQLESSLECEVRKTTNTNQYQRQPKKKGFFPNGIKVKKCQGHQNPNFIPKPVQSRGCAIQRKQILQKTCHFEDQIIKMHENLTTKKEISLKKVKKYTYSNVNLQRSHIKQKKFQSMHISRVAMNDQQKQRTRMSRGEEKQHKQLDFVWLQPWQSQDDGLYVFVDQFI